MKEMEDTGLVSRSFLTVFFVDINNLKDSLAGYRSILLRLNINPNDDPKKIIKELKSSVGESSDELKSAFILWSDSVRHKVERCQVSAESLKQIFPDIDIKELTDRYKKIMKLFTPDIEDVAFYTFEINKIFVKGTIEKIMNKMDKFYEQFSPNQ
jgi:hypothetical protein